MRKIIALITLFCFCTGAAGVSAAPAGVFVLPAPGQVIGLSPAFHPPLLKGIRVYRQDPFRFDFILDKGDAAASSPEGRETAARLIRYFLASVTIPENDRWVNLSPYEKDRIVPGAFGQTEMGRDLLAQDYILKQITASVLYPDGEVGKEFWARVYAESLKRYGRTDIPVDTFNKVWIVPQTAVVDENRDTAVVVESKLKVMLESDYVAMSHQKDMAESSALAEGVAVTQNEGLMRRGGSQTRPHEPDQQEIAKDILREIIIPILEKEVNEGKNFAALRQVYNSLILATWYKRKIKAGIMGQAYMDRNKIAGIDIADSNEKEKIWSQYVEAFRKGAYNFIKEEIDPLTHALTPRKYFSGGTAFTDHDLAQALKIRPSGAAAIMRDLGSSRSSLETVAVRAQILDGEPGHVVDKSQTIAQLAGQLATLTAAITDDDGLNSQRVALDEVLRQALALLAQQGGLPAISKEDLGRAAFGLVKKLQPLSSRWKEPARSLAISIIGDTGFASPDVKEVLLAIFHDWKEKWRIEKPYQIRETDHFDSVRNAAEALGKLFGAGILGDLLAYRDFRDPVAKHIEEELGASGLAKHSSQILRGVILGLGAIGTPASIKEIFSILKIRNIEAFREDAEPRQKYDPSIILYQNDSRQDLISANEGLVETAAEVLSGIDESIIHQALTQEFDVDALADLLRAYDGHGPREWNMDLIPASETMFKLVLPYLSAEKLVQAMNRLDPKIQARIIRFAPYGLKADVIDRLRADNVIVPGLEQWDTAYLRRQQDMVNTGMSVWPENGRTEDVKTILTHIDGLREQLRRSRSAKYLKDDLDSIFKRIPLLKTVIDGEGGNEARLLAVQRLNVPEMRALLVKETGHAHPFELPFTKGSLVEKIMADVFRLDQDYYVKYLCREVLGDRRAGGISHAQEAAVLYLGLIGDDRALPYLVEQAVNTAVKDLRSFSLEALRKIGSAWAGPYLLALFQETEYESVRKDVIAAFGGIKDEKIEGFLLELKSKNMDPELETAFLYALAGIGNKPATEALFVELEKGLAFVQKVGILDTPHKILHTLAGIDHNLWKILWAKADYQKGAPDAETIWFRGALRRLGIYAVKTALEEDPVITVKVGQYSFNDYDYNGMPTYIGKLFSRLTQLPLEDARRIIEEALPTDDQYVRFLCAMAASMEEYPAVQKLFNDSDRTHRVMAGLPQEVQAEYARLANLQPGLRNNDNKFLTDGPSGMPDEAMSGPGGIDLSADLVGLQVRHHDEDSAQLSFAPAAFQQLQHAAGLEPVIISVKPVTDLKGFFAGTSR